MPSNPNIEAYADVAELLDRAAMAPTGIRVPCDNPRAALTIRTRCYQARKADRTENKRLFQPGDAQWGKSRWENLSLRIDADAHTVIIEKIGGQGNRGVDPTKIEEF